MIAALAALNDLTWPAALVVVAIIVCIFGIPMLSGARRRGPGDLLLLNEIQEMRNELAELRSEVAELDRMLKSVG